MNIKQGKIWLKIWKSLKWLMSCTVTEADLNITIVLYISHFDCSVMSSGLQLWLWFCSYSNLALHKAGDVFTGVENGESPHDVLLQPVPVLYNFFLRDTWGNVNNTFGFNSSFRLIICQKQTWWTWWWRTTCYCPIYLWVWSVVQDTIWSNFWCGVQHSIQSSHEEACNIKEGCCEPFTSEQLHKSKYNMRRQGGGI